MLEKTKISDTQLKDTMIGKRLTAVKEEFPDDKIISQKLANIKSLLKKKWSAIYNISKKEIQTPAMIRADSTATSITQNTTKLKTPIPSALTDFKLPYIKEGI